MAASIEVPPGWRVERVEHRTHVEFEVWEDSRERPALSVECWPPDPEGVYPWADVGWPSTSDKRPELAMALAVALAMASEEATGLRAAGDLDAPAIPRRPQ